MLVAAFGLRARRRMRAAAPGSGSRPASRPRSSSRSPTASASIEARGNQIVSGAAINMLAAGLTATVGNAWYGQGGRTPELTTPDARFEGLTWPGAAAIGPDPDRSGRSHRDPRLGPQTSWPIWRSSRCRSPPSCSIGRGSGCGCGRRARTPPRSIPPGSRSAGSAMRRSRSPACSVAFPAPISRSAKRQDS